VNLKFKIFFVAFVSAAGTLCLIIPYKTYAQNPTETVKNFFESPAYEESRQYVCCEMLDSAFYRRENFKIYKMLSSRQYSLIYDSVSSALVNAVLGDTMRIDFYLYLKEGKIEYITGRWLPPEKINKDFLGDESVMRKALIKTGRFNRYIAWIERIKIYSSPDSVIIKYFNDNKQKFEAVLPSADSIKSASFFSLVEYDSVVVLRPWLPMLTIRAVYHNSYPSIKAEDYFPGVTFFEIYGIEGGASGFMYAEHETILPAMSRRRFVYIHPLGSNWYFYKTVYPK
jgi:hypothetical protein